MRAAVDSTRCEGHGRCSSICPEVFLVDEEGFASAPDREVPVDLEDKVRAAQANCPERAISLA